MRQLLSRLIGGGGLRQDNFVNAIGESAPIELAYLACRSLVALVDLQSSENCAESTGSDLKWCHRPNTNLNMTTVISGEWMLRRFFQFMPPDDGAGKRASKRSFAEPFLTNTVASLSV
jgi:hypothetical protein